MKLILTIFIFFIPFSAPASLAHPANVEDLALESVQQQCDASLSYEDLAEVLTADSGWDFVVYSVYFKTGEEVLVSMSFDGGKEVSFWVDEVFCQEEPGDEQP